MVTLSPSTPPPRSLRRSARRVVSASPLPIWRPCPTWRAWERCGPGGGMAAQCLGAVRAVEVDGRTVTVIGEHRHLASEVTAYLAAGGVQFFDLRVETSGLEDVFLVLTGHDLNGGGGTIAWSGEAHGM